MTNGRISNQDIYGALTDLRKELQGDVSRVEGKVDSAWAEITRLRIAAALLSFKVYMLVGIISIVTSAIITAIASSIYHQVTSK